MTMQEKFAEKIKSARPSDISGKATCDIYEILDATVRVATGGVLRPCQANGLGDKNKVLPKSSKRPP